MNGIFAVSIAISAVFSVISVQSGAIFLRFEATPVLSVLIFVIASLYGSHNCDFAACKGTTCMCFLF